MEQDGQCMCNVTLCHARKSLSFEPFCLNKLAAIRETNIIGLPWKRNSAFAFVVFLSYTFLCQSHKTHSFHHVKCQNISYDFNQSSVFLTN
jgi:hypothetical protein